jgi:hypothetical protein
MFTIFQVARETRDNRQVAFQREGEHMRYRGQTTSYQECVETMVQAAVELNDTQIATALGCSVWTIRKW